ncbi:MAG: PilZ domain-containing protein, partial [Terracidiphilus sp.]
MAQSWRIPASLSTPGRSVPPDDRSPLLIELSKARALMEPGQICAFNQTRECFLGMFVIAGDFSIASFQDWLATLTPNSSAGMWMAPFRGLPASQVKTPLDLLYLDVHCRVLEPVEFFPTYRVSPATPPAASVLALPSHAIFSTQTQAGDQLILCNAEEMEWRLERLARTETIVAPPPAVSAGPTLGPVLVREEPRAPARPAVIRELSARPIAPFPMDPVEIDPVQIDPVQVDPVKVDPVTVDPVQAVSVPANPVRIDPVRVPEQPIAPSVLPATPQLPAQKPESEQQRQPEAAPQAELQAQIQQPSQPAQPAKPWIDRSGQPGQSPLSKLGRWLFSSDPADPRRTARRPVPGLVAHFFTGGAPHAHEIRDVSATGLYVVTTERWYPGTVIRMTITKPDLSLSPSERSVTVHARSVRWGNDGVGLEFVVSPPSKGKRTQESALDPIDGEQL